ncbi:efflux transporter outer membrane subunit [Sphingomonas sp.]|uniref:efflux transporter outer membrane subunit n=1 Tax=Sphingomonas sp. TaxID=28214 RepID=UPI002C630D40|nr:efflux transporter outer membrane subunit [Sphingomonas sp.]HWK35524.1 efflux transporter outer membrane subunit [Sphingomonas sp.]
MRHIFLLPLVALAAACTVGPNYAGPPQATSAGAPPAGFVRAGDVARPDAPVAARWWTTLGDPTLDALEERALAGNPGVAVAAARVKQARGALRLERANQLPSVSASGLYAHAEIPGIDLGGSGSEISALNLYNVGFDASWEVDLFGGQRRTTEAARANLSAAEADAADTRVQLSAEVANAYVSLRDRQQRLALTRQAAELQERMLGLTRQREAAGTASALDVERLQGQVQTTRSQLVPLAAEIEAYLNALAVLVGEQPGAVDALLATPGAIPLPPASVAVGDPAALLQRRPDIRAAERRLAAQTARIGVAEAARFPRLSFMGIIGIGGTKPSALTDLGNISAIALPQLSWSFLDFGRNAARVGQAEGARDEAEAQYRRTVLAALQDAEDSLSRFGHRRESLAALARIKTSADRAATLMQQRQRAGTATLIDALDAERQRVLAEQNLTAATAGLTTDYIAIQKALGLGWQAQ